MLATEATRCTPQEWAGHRENPRRGLPRIVVYGARSHACGPRRSTLAKMAEGSVIVPSNEEGMPLPVGPPSDKD